MAAVKLEDLFKNDSSECEDLRQKILELLEDEETQQRAALYFSQLINQSS